MRHLCGFLLRRRPPEDIPWSYTRSTGFTPRRDVPARPAVPDSGNLAADGCGSPGDTPGQRFTTGPKVGALRRILLAGALAAASGPAMDITGLPSWTLDEGQLGDLELLLTGAFAPLTGFLNAADVAWVAER